MTRKEESTGGLETTTVVSKDATTIIAFQGRFQEALMQLASWLAVLFRGLV